MYGSGAKLQTTRESWAPPISDEDDSSNQSDEQLATFGPPVLGGRSKQIHGNFHSHQRPPEQAVINGRVVSIKVLKQPEDQHRARYMSEGSRGAIKGKHGKGHCTIQLVGFNRPTRVEIYAATEVDPMSPHPLYRVIPVLGKGGASQTTPCEEIRNAEGIPCVSVLLRPELKMTAVYTKLDCIGVLKICTHETKKQLSKTGKNPVIQLVFRAVIAEKSRDPVTIQTLSSPISCTQQLGVPEVQKVSAVSDSVRGGTELFILGKNFDKNIRIVFREYDNDGNLVWISEGDVDKKHWHQCHLVCTVPTYRNLTLKDPVEVTMTLECGKKAGHPQTFTFYPDVSSVNSGAYEENSTPEKWRQVEATREAEQWKDPPRSQEWNLGQAYFPAPVAEFLTPAPAPVLHLLEPAPTTTIAASDYFIQLQNFTPVNAPNFQPPPTKRPCTEY